MNDEDKIYRIEQQFVVLKDFPAQGLILDIGGGGEGVIGQLKGAQVVAIDIIPRELREAPAGPLKIIMDARELKFLDSSFNEVTAFFTFMFIHPKDHKKVFQEIFRILTPGGQFMLWDIEIQPRPDPQRDILIFPLQVVLPNLTINTGYGTAYTETALGVDHFLILAKDVSFEILEQSNSGKNFFLELRKPD